MHDIHTDSARAIALRTGLSREQVLQVLREAAGLERPRLQSMPGSSAGALNPAPARSPGAPKTTSYRDGYPFFPGDFSP